jgi:HEAT repeat protein
VRALREQTRKILEELHKPAPLPRRLLDASARQRQLLTQVVEAKEIAAVPHLTPLLPFLGTFPGAAAAIAELMEGVSHEDLLALHEMRGCSGIEICPSERYWEWIQMRPERLGEFDYAGRESMWLLGLASFHNSGYVREAAIKRLAGRPESETLSFLLLRANDWVPAVRRTAKKALDKKVKTQPLPQFACVLPLVERLRRGRREDHSALVESVCSALRDEPNLGTLSTAARDPDRYVRRIAFRLAWTREDDVLGELFELASRDNDVPTRVEAARRICRMTRPGSWHSRLLRDRVAAVRRVAISEAAAAEKPNEQVLEACLLDPSSGIRSDARFYLRKCGWDDFSSFYRRHLDPGTEHLHAALLGLGDTGCRADAELVQPFLDQSRTKTRRAAVTALARLAAKNEVDPFITALTDTSPSVSHAARDALIARGVPVSPDCLWRIVEGKHSVSVVKNGVRLLSRLGRWTSIKYLLDAVRFFDDEIREFALVAVDRWIVRSNLSFIAPNACEASTLADSLTRANRTLDDQRLRVVQHALTTWTKE